MQKSKRNRSKAARDIDEDRKRDGPWTGPPPPWRPRHPPPPQVRYLVDGGYIGRPPPLMSLPPRSHPEHYLPSHPDSCCENEKKQQFAAFLQTLSTFMVQARNNDEDLKILRGVLYDVFKENEKTGNGLVGPVSSSTPVFTSLSLRIQRLEENSNDEKSVIQRLSNLESLVTKDKSSLEFLKRLESVEKALSVQHDLSKKVENIDIFLNSQKNEVQQLILENEGADVAQRMKKIIEKQNFETTVNDRLSKLEEMLSNNSSVLERLKAVEFRLDNLQLPLISQSYATCNESSLINSNCESSSPQIESAGKRKRKASENNCEDIVEKKPAVFINGGIQFIINADEAVVVHTDGVGTKCSTTPAGVRVWFGQEHPLNVSRPLTRETSNTSAQLLAAQIALEIARQAGINKLAILTSSHPLANFERLKHNDWRKKSGKIVKDLEDWKKLARALNTMSVTFEKLSLNNEARGLAVNFPTIKLEPE